MNQDQPQNVPVDNNSVEDQNDENPPVVFCAEDNTNRQPDQEAVLQPNELELRINLPQHARKPINRIENPSVFTLGNLENPPNPETVKEAHALYLLMLTERMCHLGLQLNQLGLNTRLYQPSYRNSRSLRTLAARFEQSRQRRWVHEQAMNVDLDSLNYQTFQQLLNGLFEEGGVTWERVMVLFYFCSDITIRTFKEKFVRHFVDIYNWTTIFLSGRFSSWVDAEGGWNVVLDNSVSYLFAATMVAGCAAAIALGYMFLKKK